MASPYATDPATRAGGTIEAAVSAVSWPAIFAGGSVMLASSFVLVELGTGVGLTAISPWPQVGMSAASFAVTTAIWLIVVQWLASALGGYVAGRLRTKWVGTHTHEVFFRDTAHGFITWAVASVIGAVIIASAASSIIGGGVRATATVAAGAAQGAGGAASALTQTRGYDVDTLFRSTQAAPASAPATGTTTTTTSAAASSAAPPNGAMADARGEATRILTMSMANGDVSATDRSYLADLVAARTGIAKDEAQRRVDQAITAEKAAAAKAREAADKARKAAANLAIFMALSMIVGAFIASVAASIGGQERDKHP
jgi:hypothetical protein